MRVHICLQQWDMKILVNLRKSCFDLTRGRSLLTGADLEKYLWGGNRDREKTELLPTAGTARGSWKKSVCYHPHVLSQSWHQEPMGSIISRCIHLHKDIRVMLL